MRQMPTTEPVEQTSMTLIDVLKDHEQRLLYDNELITSRLDNAARRHYVTKHERADRRRLHRNHQLLDTNRLFQEALT